MLEFLRISFPLSFSLSLSSIIIHILKDIPEYTHTSILNDSSTKKRRIAFKYVESFLMEEA